MEHHPRLLARTFLRILSLDLADGELLEQNGAQEQAAVDHEAKGPVDVEAVMHTSINRMGLYCPAA